MATSKREQHREIAARYAEKWGVDPDTVLWEGALYFDQLATYPPQFVWSYQEWVKSEDGTWEREEDGIARKLVKRRRPIPEEWIEEYEQAVQDLFQN